MQFNTLTSKAQTICTQNFEQRKKLLMSFKYYDFSNVKPFPPTSSTWETITKAKGSIS